MKTRIFLSLLAFGITINAFTQKLTMELTFTAENNGHYVPLDSIIIENLTQGGDTTLYAPDTVLVLDYITSIKFNETVKTNTISVSQNYPNPFKGKTEFDLHLPEREHIDILVRDVLGRVLVHYDNQLNQGKHSFTFYSGNEKYYLLTVNGKKASKTIKMLTTSSYALSGGTCKIVYEKHEDIVVGFKSQKAIDAFEFSIGDELKYTGYTDVEEIEIVDSPNCSQVYTFPFTGWTPCPGASIVTDIDGNIYNTVQIGNQCWMKKDLKTTTYNNGTSIPNITDPDEWADLVIGAYVWPNNDSSWKDLYGAIYNWYAVDNPNDLCPTGWHVPTNDEWIELTDFIGGTDVPHGSELKSCRQVNSPLGEKCNIINHPRWKEYYDHYGTDNYGFSGLPGGFRASWGSLNNNVDEYSYFWSSTESSPNNAWVRILGYFYGDILEVNFNKNWGLLVRCLKD